MKSLFDHRPQKVGARRLGRHLGLLASSALVLTAAMVAPASPAVAGCARTFTFGGAQAQIDNCPGNGRASWGWMYGSPDYSWSTVYVRLTNGVEYTMEAGSGQSSGGGWDLDVRTIAICNTKFFTWVPPTPIVHCSAHTPV